MDIESLLGEAGLTAPERALLGAAVAVQRGAWPRFRDWLDAGRARGLRRADVEEALLQCVLFCGFPRTLTAFTELAEHWPTAAPPAGGGLPPSEQATAGRALFARIYGRHDETVRRRLQELHGELHDFVLESAYGRILSRPGLPARTRELLAVALLAAQDQRPQFVSHAYGARTCGADDAALEAAVRTTFDGDERLAQVWLAALPS